MRVQSGTLQRASRRASARLRPYSTASLSSYRTLGTGAAIESQTGLETHTIVVDESYSGPVPGPRGYSLIGVLRQLRSDPIRVFLDAADRYGDLVRLKAGPMRAASIDAESISVDR
jgi:hypothetical protein